MKSFSNIKWLVFAALSLWLSSARAFPPAPTVLVYGMAVDQYGVPLVNTADTIIVQTPGGVRVSAPIQPNLAVGVNYAVQVPMDSGIVPAPYAANALTNGVQFTLYVTVGSTTNLPIEMAGGGLLLAAPSQRMLQNLTIGGDANGDGIPDAWEAAFLASLGTNIALANINPNGIYTPDGRTLRQQYLLGNYPYNPNAFRITIVSQNAGSAVLAFNTTAGRTYTVYGSTDLIHWTQLAFTVPATGAVPATSYYSAAIQAIQIQTVQPAHLPPVEFFRVQLQ